MVLADGRPAAAANGAPVIIGADNVASDQTLIRNTATFPIGGNRAIFASCTTMTAGIGIETSGSRFGLFAVGRNDQSQSPSSGASGLQAMTFSADGYGAVLDAGSGLAPLRIVPMAIDGAPTTGTHGAGEIVVDSNGRFFACTAFGTPGTWVELDGAVEPARTDHDPHGAAGDGARRRHPHRPRRRALGRSPPAPPSSSRSPAVLDRASPTGRSRWPPTSRRPATPGRPPAAR